LEKYANINKPKREQNPYSKYYNLGDINLFDEDIKAIFESDGLIGLILNEKRMPGEGSTWTIKKLKRKIKRFQNDSDLVKKLKDELKDVYIEVIAANIFHIIKVCNSKKAWDMITLGTDFDGMIDGIDEYIGVDDFPKLADDLQIFIESDKDILEGGISLQTKRELMFGFSTKEIIEKIMYKNAQNFLEKYFHDNFLIHGKPGTITTES